MIFKEKILSFVLWMFKSWIEEFLEDDFEVYAERVIVWAEKDAIGSPSDQCMNLMSSVGELAGAVRRDDGMELSDAVGDVLFRLVILCKQYGVTPTGCLAGACAAIAADKKSYGDG